MMSPHGLTRLYSWLLHLYPVAFQADYADEMRDVFRQVLREARQQGRLTVTGLVLKELLMLPLNAVAQHLHTPPIGDALLRRGRFVTRGASLLLNGFFLWVLAQIVMESERLYPGSNGVYLHAFPFLIALPLANLMMLVAWRWERVGGWLTIAGGLTVMLTSAYSLIITGRLMQMDVEVMIPALIANLLWLLPHLLFGLLFLSFDRRGRKVAS
jgi:hypothetical protein